MNIDCLYKNSLTNF